MAQAGDARASGGRDGRKSGGKDASAKPQGPLHATRTVVYRKPGVVVAKVGQLEKAAFRLHDIAYLVEFEGCQPLRFERMKEALERAVEPAPEPMVTVAA